MNNDTTTPLYTLDRDKLREVSIGLQKIWEWPMLTNPLLSSGAQSTTDVASDKEPV